LVWRGVEFWPFPLTCFVAFKTLSHYRASVWLQNCQCKFFTSLFVGKGTALQLCCVKILVC